MTRFQELDDAQQDAIKEAFLRGVDRRIREEIEYTNQVYRFLVYGNGAGIALLATFMGALAATGNPIATLVTPLWKFAAGALCAALIYVPLLAVATDATKHMLMETQAFFLNQKDLELVKGYGLNRLGLWTVRLLALLSLGFFAFGLYQCMRILSAL